MLVFTLMLLFFSILLPARADNWPSAFHDPANTCVSSEAIRMPLSPAWTADAAGYVQQYPVAANGILIVPGNEGLVALRLADGARIWKVAGTFHNAYITDNILYIAKRLHDAQQHEKHHLLAFDITTGQIRWDVPWKGDGSFLSDRIDGLTGYQQYLFVVDGKTRLIEINPANGVQTHAVQLPAWSKGLPAFADKYSYWGGGHVLTTLSLTAWKTTTWGIWDGGNSYPIVWKDYLAIQGPILTTQVYRLQDGTPTLLHRFYGLKGVGHGIAPVGDGLLLSRSENPTGYLAARGLADGKICWQAPMDVTSMCSATAEYVYVCGRNRKRDRQGRPLAEQWQDALFVIRARDGKIAAKYPLPGWGTFPPVITDRRVIVAVANEVRCYISADK
ncbi:MAG: outer membrane protein assembly factor BamB family protein [Armatimonadota bacterium]